MTDAYEVRTKEFSGPLDTLLQLIDEKKFDITTVSLADVTVDFLTYIKSFGPDTPSGILADFLVVGAKLVLIKSKALLPGLALSDEEEGAMQDLESRLRLYREFSARSGGASKHLHALWLLETSAYPRPYLHGLGDASFFYPSSQLTAQTLHRIMALTAEEILHVIAEPTTIRQTIIRLEDKINELLARFKVSAAETSKNLAMNRSRSEVIVLFLALLHVFKGSHLAVEQKGQFGDILISKKGDTS